MITASLNPKTFASHLQLCVVSSFVCSCCLTINPCEYEVHFSIPLKNIKEIIYNIFQIIYLSAN